MFSLVSDTNSGRLLPPLFRRFLKDLLQLACSVQEQQFYQFDEQLIAGMFGRRLLCTVTLTEFTQLFFAATGPPPILSWFVILHKMTQVEYTVHHCSCSCCGRSELVGFRYKCQKCFNYNLCQLCFWQGKATGSHNPETHSCKEYLHWRSASKQLSDSLRRSFRLKSSSKSRLHLSEQPATIPSKSLIVHSPQTQSIVLDTISPFIPSSPAASQRSPQHFPVISNYSPSLNGSESIVNRLPETCSFQTTPLNSTLINEYQRYGPSYATDLYEGHQNSHRERSNWNDLDDYGRASMTELIAAAPYTLDEEHRLIARYAMNLARTGSSRTASRTQKNVSESSSGQDFTATNSCSSNLTALAAFETQLFGTLPVDPTVLHQEQLISELEAKNREMMREIVRLREFSPSSDYNSMGNERPPNGYFNSAGHSSGSSCSAHSQADVIEELHILRDRKDELEMHLESLQDSRVELKNQLHHLIGLSKNYSQKISLPASACSSLSQASGRRMQMLLSDKTVSKDGSLDSTLNRVADALEREKSSYHSSNPIELAGSIEDKLKIGSAGSSQSKLMLSTDRKDIDDSFNQRWKTSSDAVLPLKPDSKEAEKVVTDTTKHSKIPIPNGGLNKSISQARKETSNNRSASEEVGIDKVVSR